MKFSTLQEEVGVYQRRAEQLDETAQQNFSELNEAEKRINTLTAELITANDKIESLNSKPDLNTDQDIDFSLHHPDSEKELKKALAREEQQGIKVTELEFRSNNLQNRVDEQDKLLQQANRDIKKLNSDLKAANEKLISKSPAISAEVFAELEEKLTLVNKEKEESEQKLQQTSSELVLHKSTNSDLEARTEALEKTIERQADELLEEKKKARQITDEIESLRSQLSNLNDSNDEELTTLQGKLDQETEKKIDVEQKLKEACDDAQQKQAKALELQSELEKLENTVEKQSSELQDADTKIALMADDLKAALEQMEKQNRASTEKLGEIGFTLDATTNEKDQLEQKLRQAVSRADTQTSLANDLQQKLKQSETAAKERDDAIARLKQLEDDLNNADQQNSELEQTKTQLENISQRFRNFQASAVAHRQSREEQIEKLRARVEQLKASLDQQREKLSSSGNDSKKILQLESQLTEAKKVTTELNHANLTIVELKKQLGDATSELAGIKENNQTDDHSLKQKNQELSRKLQAATQANKELDETKTKLAEITTQLNNAKAHNKQPAAVTPISVAQINKLKKTVEEKDEKIIELTEKLKLRSAKKASEKKNSVTKKKNLSSQPRETKIGTAGSDHKDDLTAINGIGPKIEKVLNQLGIKSWEQLATLKAADIKRLDDKLVDFTGRITRDEWVPQAKAIIRNGHQPVTKTPKASNKKSNKNKTTKLAWQQGQTRFGTPGSIHKDDLQVINGIGPVIESALNRRGIKSWEQLASLKAKEIKTIDEALDFPGRIKRENWVAQAKALIKQFPNHKDRPTRRTFLNQMAVAR